MGFKIEFTNDVTKETVVVDSDDIETFERLWEDRNWHIAKELKDEAS